MSGPQEMSVTVSVPLETNVALVVSNELTVKTSIPLRANVAVREAR